MRLSTVVAAVLAGTVLCVTPLWAKTVKECNAEYAANKPAIQGTQKKADFITACRAGTETIPGGAAASPAAPSAPAAPAPAQTATPAPAPVAPPTTQAPSRRTTRTAPPLAAGSPITANQFATEAQAMGRCPSATVVWLNTKSGVYHFAGTKNYGNTKAGAYMCETDATAAGDRASKTEKHP